jgi:hypothetical protein
VIKLAAVSHGADRSRLLAAAVVGWAAVKARLIRIAGRN